MFIGIIYLILGLLADNLLMLYISEKYWALFRPRGRLETSTSKVNFLFRRSNISCRHQLGGRLQGQCITTGGDTIESAILNAVWTEGSIPGVTSIAIGVAVDSM